MGESKYEQYFIKNVIKENKFGGEGLGLSAVPQDIIPPAARLSLGITAVKKPYMFHEPTHKHLFTEYFVFFGSNPMEMEEFNADVEFSFGAEKEKNVISSPTIIVAPPGTYHCPLNYARIGQPFYCLEAFLTSKYSGVDLGEDIHEIRIEEPSYKRFLTRGVVRGNKFGGQGISLSQVPEHLIPAASRLSLAISVIRKPYMFHEPTHKHNFTEFFIFFGSNPLNLQEFDAEIEFTFGPEKEKHIINSPTIVVAPPGVYHCPLNYVRVGKPFYCVEVFMTPRYSGTDLEPKPA
ncbi:MAG TPA: hypothetical protein VLH15_11020 [Dehalococcoidales bacterium]|nr:hypothetical protein [Dehalococcoidales bacterium]